MEEIRAAIETACQTGQTQQVKVTNVESLIIAQGGQISENVPASVRLGGRNPGPIISYSHFLRNWFFLILH